MNEEETVEEIDSQLEMVKAKIDGIDRRILMNGGKNQGWLA